MLAGRLIVLLLVFLVLTSTVAVAQPTEPPDDHPVPSTSPATPDYLHLFRPIFDTKTLLWFGALLWLLMAVDYRRFWSARTLDVFVVVLLPILFVVRNDDRQVSLFDRTLSYDLIVWTGFAAVAAYFTLRTLGQLLRREAREWSGPTAGAAVWVLFGFAICTTYCSLTEMDLGAHAVEAMTGSSYTRSTGMLPYGQPGITSQNGPLLYLLHASLAGSGTAAAPANWVAGAAHALVLLGMVILGWQYHSVRLGAMLAGLYALLPPVLDQVTSPDITVPAGLIIWALITAAPAAGSLGAAVSGILLAAAAGMMFYPALLGPVWFAYFLRRPKPVPNVRSYSSLAFLLAFLLAGGGIAGYAVNKTMPMPSRTPVNLVASPDNPFRRPYTLTITNGRWMLTGALATTTTTAEKPQPNATAFTQWLASDGGVDTDGPVLAPEKVTQIPESAWSTARVTTQPADALNKSHGVPLRWIRPADAEAARALAVIYQQAVAEYPWWRRSLAATRTILENSWMALAVIETPQAEPPGGVWALWRQREVRQLDGKDAGSDADSLIEKRIRRIDQLHEYTWLAHATLCVVIFIILLAAASRCTPWHLCAATAAIVTATQLWKPANGGTDFAWFLPLVVAALLSGRKPPAAVPSRRLSEAA